MTRVISLNVQLNFHQILKEYLKEAPILNNNKIKLRPINPIEDAQDFYLLSKEISLDYGFFMEPILTIDEAAAYLMGCRDNNKIMIWSIEHTEFQHWIGLAWLMPNHEGSQDYSDIRIRMVHPYQERYFNLVMNTLVKFAFHELNMDNIYIKEWKKNIFAIRAIEHFGFKEIEEKEVYSKKNTSKEKVGIYSIFKGLRLVK